MRVIYADSMILLNFAIDYMLLLAAGKICALPLKRPRMALAALFGGLSALTCALPSGTPPAALKIGGGLLMTAIAFGGLGSFPRTAIVFFAVSAAFGGASYALMGIGGGSAKLSPRLLLLSFALCYAGLSIVFKGRLSCRPRDILTAELYLWGQRLTFPALRDTGSELRDSRGNPVMTAEWSLLSPLFPKLDIPPNYDPAEFFLALSAQPGMEGRCRLFPCLTATDNSALLPAFRPDLISLGEKTPPPVYIAIVPGPLSSDGSYRAVF